MSASGTDRAWARQFYSSRAWQDCRKAYAKSVGGLCESCLARGLVVPGVQVHHKIPISPQNIEDPSITLNWDNLELLCESHHQQKHMDRRYQINEDGTLEIL